MGEGAERPATSRAAESPTRQILRPRPLVASSPPPTGAPVLKPRRTTQPVSRSALPVRHSGPLNAIASRACPRRIPNDLDGLADEQALGCGSRYRSSGDLPVAPENSLARSSAGPPRSPSPTRHPTKSRHRLIGRGAQMSDGGLCAPDARRPAPEVPREATRAIYSTRTKIRSEVRSYGCVFRSAAWK